MPAFCFPCSPQSVASHFDEKQTLETSRGRADEDGLQKPTGVEYTSEAAKEFLNVLEAVAQDIPIPGVGVAVKIATNLIKACEESHATLGKAQELKLRIKTLVTVVINELKGKKSDEIRAKLKEDVEALQSELKYVEKKLDEIASQHAFLLVFFRSLNDEKVLNCMSRLDGLLERFTIARQIDHANLLDRLEKEIVGFYNAQKQTLDDIHGVVDEINVTMKDVRAMMKNVSPSTGSGSASARATVPANKSVFYGRDALVSEIVTHLTNPSDNQERNHICILGAGGMGKTSAALAIMAHADVKRYYPDSQRVWVPCIKATSAALLLDTLASSLGIAQTAGNVKENILSTLKSAGRLVLLFDNFETPWNAEDGRTEAEETLRNIDQIPQITLFITMRSSTPPCGELPWHMVDLKAVDAEAARQIYSRIYPESGTDPKVPALLQLVGHIPLAITLMATSGKLSGLLATDLIDQYEHAGPTMMSQGFDREHNMNICIGLSVDSPPMKRSPEAQWLLAALSMLPAGTTYNMLRTCYARGLSNLTGALQVLRETSLVELSGSAFSVLPVVQRYIVDPSRFDTSVCDSMVTSACEFLGNYKSLLDDSFYRADTSALAAEEGNLETILLQTVTPSAEVLNTLLALAKYQEIARPRTSIITHALTLAKQMQNQSIHASVLSCYGSICYNLNRYSESRTHHTAAREIFLSIPDIKQAAYSLLTCVQTYQSDYTATSDVYIPLAAQAESELESIGDAHGVARCWLIRGLAARQDFDYDEALRLLHLAQDKFTELGSSWKSAECSRIISSSYYWKGDFEQAKTWAQSSVQVYDHLGPSNDSINGLLQLGYTYTTLGTHDMAIRTLIRALEQSKASGGPLHVGLALEYIGITWLQMGRREDAQGAFQDALEAYPSVPGRSDHTRCRYWLRKAEHPNVTPTYEEWQVLKLWYHRKALTLYGVRK